MFEILFSERYRNTALLPAALISVQRPMVCDFREDAGAHSAVAEKKHIDLLVAGHG
ncbi:MAG: hypothetical protein QNK18_16345 [Gammaproteobacteria bacterium]|nr:hypothetical protein [Gammaproteobacteria bacterium]